MWVGVSDIVQCGYVVLSVLVWVIEVEWNAVVLCKCICQQLLICSLPDFILIFSVSFLYTHTYIYPILLTISSLHPPCPLLALVIPVNVAPSSYIPALKDQFFLNISVFAREETTDFNFVARDTFRSGTCLYTDLFPFI